MDSVAEWLNRDRHDQYRYVTLGFGEDISRLAVLTDAGSVDGEWNSERRLPELTSCFCMKSSLSSGIGISVPIDFAFTASSNT